MATTDLGALRLNLICPPSGVCGVQLYTPLQKMLTLAFHYLPPKSFHSLPSILDEVLNDGIHTDADRLLWVKLLHDKLDVLEKISEKQAHHLNNGRAELRTEYFICKRPGDVLPTAMIPLIPSEVALPIPQGTYLQWFLGKLNALYGPLLRMKTELDVCRLKKKAAGRDESVHAIGDDDDDDGVVVVTRPFRQKAEDSKYLQVVKKLQAVSHYAKNAVMVNAECIRTFHNKSVRSPPFALIKELLSTNTFDVIVDPEHVVALVSEDDEFLGLPHGIKSLRTQGGDNWRVFSIPSDKTAHVAVEKCLLIRHIPAIF
jgi:hypothetical protein